MTSKRPSGDATDEEPDLKRNCTRNADNTSRNANDDSSRNTDDNASRSADDKPSRNVDDDTPRNTDDNTYRSADDETSDYGNETKTVANEENIPLLNFIQEEKETVDDVDAQVKNDPVEVKDEGLELKDESPDELKWDGPEWDISEEEKPLDCEAPLEMDDIDPLQPFDAVSEMKNDSMDGVVKSEDGEGSYASAEVEGSEEFEEIKSGDLEVTLDPRHVSFQDAIVVPNPKCRALNHNEPHDDDAGRGFQEEIPKTPSNPPTRTDKPDTAECDGPDRSFIVQLLVETHFLQKNRTTKQENDIILAGRPTPLMGNLPKFQDLTKFLEGFWATEREYERIPWLTGFKKHLRYFCWPCLLFTEDRWSFQGGESSQKFSEAINEHNENPLHRVAYENLKLCESELKASNIIGINPSDIVRTNRALLTLLIRILCSKKTKLNSLDSSFDGYEELMKVAISYEPQLHESFRKPFSEDGLADFVSRHAQKILPSIQTKISARIYEEMSNIPFVSLIYEDTESVLDTSSQVAVILRFVSEKGDICERFVKLVKIGQSRNAYDILEVHTGLVKELGIREKLVGYTFSGTVIAPASIEDFTEIVSKESPRAKFFYHPDHNLKDLLMQSLSHLEECQRFLEVISDLLKFLNTNAGAIPTLTTFIKHNEPNCQLSEDATSFTINIISTIRRCYPLIVQFFQKVSQKFWNDEIAKHAPAFTKFLQDPLNRFLIVEIAAILDTVEDLCTVMEKGYDSAQWKSQSTKVLEKLNELKINGAKHFLCLASNGKMQPSQDQLIGVGVPKYYAEIFRKIIDTAMNCVLHRVGKADSFYLNSTHSKASEVLQASESWNRYGFRCNTTKDFQDHMNFFNICNATFSKKSIPEIVKAVSNMRAAPKLQEWMCFLRFCALAISPAKSTPSAPSAVLRLKSYVKDKQKFDPTEVLMFMEKDSLCSQLKTEEFIEDVISYYAKKNNQYNFLYDFADLSKSEIEKF